MTIDITDLKKEIQIEGVTYLLVPKTELENILNQQKSYKEDIAGLKQAVLGILRLMGLLDEETGTLKAKIKSGEESYIKHILKALKDTMFLMMGAGASKKKEAELADKFSFIKPILPILEKHSTPSKQTHG